MKSFVLKYCIALNLFSRIRTSLYSKNFYLQWLTKCIHLMHLISKFDIKMYNLFALGFESKDLKNICSSLRVMR